MEGSESPELAEAFEWDDDEREDGNTAHLATHDIAPWEVEEMWANGAPIFPNKRRGSGEWMMIGLTNAARPLTVIMSYHSVRRCIRAFTGWESTDAEKIRRDRSAT